MDLLAATNATSWTMMMLSVLVISSVPTSMMRALLAATDATSYTMMILSVRAILSVQNSMMIISNKKYIVKLRKMFVSNLRVGETPHEISIVVFVVFDVVG